MCVLEERRPQLGHTEGAEQGTGLRGINDNIDKSTGVSSVPV
jgi:hypothetical protein